MYSILNFLDEGFVSPWCFNQCLEMLSLKIYLHPIAPLLHIAMWNFLDTYTMVHSIFVSLVFWLFWFSIFTLTTPGIVAHDPVFLIVHKDNSYHGFVISISVGMLLLVVHHYKSSLLRLLYQFSLILGSSIPMLLKLLFCCFAHLSFKGIIYTWVLCRLWWVGVGYYLLLSIH